MSYKRSLQRAGKKLSYILILVLLLGIKSTSLYSQELNAKVSINTERLGTVDKQQFADLERQLSDLINLNRWTNATYSPAERIECSFTINLLTMTDDGSYTAEIYVSSQRPVFNSSYNSPMLSYRDTELNFKYNSYEPIEYNANDLNSNLVATVVFYVYFVLAIDSDSFSELGGSFARSHMQQLVTRAQQMQEWTGWRAYDSDYNRYAIAEAFNDPAQEPFRKYWYIYHRKGLDELVGNVRRGYTNILENLNLLEESWKTKSTSPLLRVFSQSKLDELSKVADEAPNNIKTAAYKILNKVFPTEEEKYISLKR